MDRLFKLTLLATMIVTVLMFASSCGLDKKVHELLYPKYETKTARYIVKNGDTVWDVAENYFLEQDKIKNFNEFVYMVRHRNGFTQSKRVLKVGDVLYIPLSKRVAQ